MVRNTPGPPLDPTTPAQPLPQAPATTPVPGPDPLPAAAATVAPLQQRYQELQAEHAKLQQAYAQLEQSHHGLLDALASPATAPLPATVAECQDLIRRLHVLAHNDRRTIDYLTYRVAWLVNRLYGRSSERSDPEQPWLFPEMSPALTPPAPPPPPASAEPPPRKKRDKHGRRKLPDDLERRRREYVLDETSCHCHQCGTALRHIGCDIATKAGCEPMRVFVLELVQHKYVCPHCAKEKDTAAPHAPPTLAPGEPPAAASEPAVCPPVAPPTSQPAAPLHNTVTAALRQDSVPPTTTTVTTTAPDPSAPRHATMAAPTPAPPTNFLPVLTTVAVLRTPCPVPAAALTTAELTALLVDTPSWLPSATLQLVPEPLAAAPTQLVASTSLLLVPTAERPPPLEHEIIPVKLDWSKVNVHGIITVPRPPELLPGCLADVSLLAQVLTGKYCDHLPLYRLQQILRRSGIHIAASTMGDWVAGCAAALRPLYDLMHQRLLRSHVLHADETHVDVLDRHHPQGLHQGWFWVYVGDCQQPYVLIDFQTTRGQIAPEKFLHGFQGRYLQADAYGGYNPILASGQVLWVACWAHARRKFHDLLALAPELANGALQRIGKLYRVEEECRTLTVIERYQQRQAKSVPELQALQAWLEQQLHSLLPKDPARAAINYVLQDWDAFLRYTADGALAIDNNVAERTIRPLAVGRKAWLFLGNDQAGQAAAVHLSLVATCRRHNVDCYAYFADVLRRLPTQPRDRLAELLPDIWQQLQG